MMTWLDKEVSLKPQRLNNKLRKNGKIPLKNYPKVLKENNPKGKNCGDVADFWDIPTKPSSTKHYATYNDELLKKPILAGCPIGGLVYDPFMGTGTTAMVCFRSNRNLF